MAKVHVEEPSEVLGRAIAGRIPLGNQHGWPAQVGTTEPQINILTPQEQDELVHVPEFLTVIEDKAPSTIITQAKLVSPLAPTDYDPRHHFPVTGGTSDELRQEIANLATIRHAQKVRQISSSRYGTLRIVMAPGGQYPIVSNDPRRRIFKIRMLSATATDKVYVGSDTAVINNGFLVQSGELPLPITTAQEIFVATDAANVSNVTIYASWETDE